MIGQSYASGFSTWLECFEGYKSQREYGAQDQHNFHRFADVSIGNQKSTCSCKHQALKVRNSLTTFIAF